MSSAPAPADLLPVAEEIARTCGTLLRERFLAGAESEIHSKSSATDLASAADLAAEAAAREILAERRPDDAILAEEGGGAQAVEPGRVRWIVDSLDGTINFLFRIPQWCVSVACEDERGTLAGVVYDPMREELFAATLDGPATLNGEELRAGEAEPREFAHALVATGFAYDSALRSRQAETVARLIPRVRDIRRMGSAAQDLAWVAAGRYDAYYERNVQLWDVAAGVLICARAGLDTRELAPSDGLPWGVMVGSRPLLDALAEFRP
jgi:myo-inositol-1(or 4)-monophosphatase